MALQLYRRHRRDCKAGHPEDSRTGEFEERRKGFKRCDCPIFAAGTINGCRKRQSTAQWEWDAARATIVQIEATGSIPAPPPPGPAHPQRTTIKDSTEAFLAKCQNRGVAEATLRKYKTFVKQLSAYCDNRGYVFIDQLTIDDMDRFYASWKDGPQSKARKLDRLRAFTKFCLRRKWIADNIADDLQSPQGSSESANKSPFTDDELTSIYSACDTFGPPISGGPGSRSWGGEDARDFVMLAVYTGLRISDICLFDITKRLHGNDVFLRMHKTKKELFTWIPDWLVARLRAREESHGPHIFLVGKSMNVRTVTEQWRRRMRKIFKLASPFEERPHPHRFRATFARVLLQNGVELQDVADLIGDTPAVLIKHYARWMPARQVRLTKILRKAFADKNQSKLV